MTEDDEESPANRLRETPGIVLEGEILRGVHQYQEARPEPLRLVHNANGRLCVLASYDDGLRATEVDLIDLIRWLRKHHPELLEAP